MTLLLDRGKKGRDDPSLSELSAPFPVLQPVDQRLPLLARLAGHIRTHRISVVLGVVLFMATVAVRSYRLAEYPRRFTDEGVYVQQAAAVLYEGILAFFTYWYDHPPFGWIQIAWISGITGAFERHAGDSTLAGRESMVLAAAVASVLIYVLGRRLKMRRSFAFLAGLLFVISPLANAFGRYVLLDNIAVPWLLAAMVLALSPQRRMSAAIFSGLCLTGAVLSKETAIIAGIAVPIMLLVNYRKADNRAWACVVWVAFAFVSALSYPFYAWLKDELTPGPGHVSWWGGQIEFQLTSRTGSGHVLDIGSDAYRLVQNAWLSLDPWLPIAGMVAMVPALLVPRLWGMVIALGTQTVVLLLREGYLPYPYNICMLPFCALLVAGVLDAWWPSHSVWPSRDVWRRAGLLDRLRSGVVSKLWWRRCLQVGLAVLGIVLTLGVAFPAASYAAPDYRDKLAYQFTTDDTASQRAALDWVDAHVPKNSAVVAEGQMWYDLYSRGYRDPEVYWTYKLDTDPEVQAVFDKTGADYLVLDQLTVDGGMSEDYVTLPKLIEKSDVIATFGENQQKIVVLQVRKE